MDSGVEDDAFLVYKDDIGESSHQLYDKTICFAVVKLVGISQSELDKTLISGICY